MSRRQLEHRLREALRHHEVPEQEAAEQRAWRLIEAASAEGPPHGHRPLWRRRIPQAAVALGLLAVLISPAGAEVREWVDDAVTPGREPSRPALTSLPAAGRLLVESDLGPWVVGGDGSKRLLGDYLDATWSRRGLFVAATTEHELVAVDPQGSVRWTLARRGPVRLPSWNSPRGFRVAYLDGRSLRVVAGDGTADHLLARDVAPVSPAWRPGARYALAFAEQDGRVRVVAADSGKTIFVTATGSRPVGLRWFSDGSRLLVVRASAIEFLNADGELVSSQPAPRGTRIQSAELAPDGRRIAIVVRNPFRNRSRLVLTSLGGRMRDLFTGPGRFANATWSPDGQWLLLGWESADQWLFLNRANPAKIISVSNISAQFAPGGSAPTSFPDVVGWCCAESR